MAFSRTGSCRRSFKQKDAVELEKVLGLTITSRAALAFDTNNHLIAYPAGCTVVLYDPKSDKQNHIINTTQNKITCLAFTRDGKYLVTGEEGSSPKVRIWDIKKKTQHDELLSHKCRINGVAHVDGFIVSVGCWHCNTVNVWRWPSGILETSSQITYEVVDITHSISGNTFVTLGKEEVDFWNIKADEGEGIYLERTPVKPEGPPHPLFINGGFTRRIDDEKIFCISGERESHLYTFDKFGVHNNPKKIEVSHPRCLCVGDGLLYLGFNQGIVQAFSVETTELLATIPLPHRLGVDVKKPQPQEALVDNAANVTYPDVLAIAVDSAENMLCCVYSDHSLYIWDVKNLDRISKERSFLFHSRAIWDIDVYPELGEDMNNSHPEPPNSFITCSDDGTVRVWNCFQSNSFSRELHDIIYVGDGFVNITAPPDTHSNQTEGLGANSSFSGLCSLGVSPDGRCLSIGDHQGKISIRDLQEPEETVTMEICKSDVSSVEFSNGERGQFLMATAKRKDRLYIFDRSQNYAEVPCPGGHSQRVCSARFIECNDRIHVASSGADNALIIREARKGKMKSTPKPPRTPAAEKQDRPLQFHIVETKKAPCPINDMCIDHVNKRIVAACKDNKIRIYSLNRDRKHRLKEWIREKILRLGVKEFEVYQSRAGKLDTIAINSTGGLVAVCCTDKTMAVADTEKGKYLDTMWGHSLQATGVTFLRDGQHLVTISRDGCIFVWSLAKIRERVATGSSADKGSPALKGSKLPGSSGTATKKARTIPTRNMLPKFKLPHQRSGIKPPLTDPRDRASSSESRTSVGKSRGIAESRIPGQHQGIAPNTPTNQRSLNSADTSSRRGIPRATGTASTNKTPGVVPSAKSRMSVGGSSNEKTSRRYSASEQQARRNTIGTKSQRSVSTAESPLLSMRGKFQSHRQSTPASTYIPGTRSKALPDLRSVGLHRCDKTNGTNGTQNNSRINRGSDMRHSSKLYNDSSKLYDDTMDYTAWSSDDGYDDMDGSIHEVDLNESNLLSLSITQDTEIKILEETLKKQNEEMEKIKKENEDLRKELCRFAKVDTKDEQTQTDAEEEVVNSTFQEAICDRYSYV